MLKVAVLGASGRMGRAVVRAIDQSGDICVVGAVASGNSSASGTDAGTAAGVAECGAAITADCDQALEAAQVAIDFSLPAATPKHLDACVAASCPLVIGTTGLDDDLVEQLRDAGGAIPLLHAPNMSVGINLCLRLADLAARTLGADYDVDILEAHHRGKIDAPSGTALQLGRAVAAAQGAKLEDIAEYHAKRSGGREKGAIAFSSIRAGDIVGEHRVLFAGDGERVEIAHAATDRMTFARGAIRAARWLVSRPPGLYSMADVLDLPTV